MHHRQLIFLGAPGSGKGTQSDLLVKEGSYLHVSTGDLLRREIKLETELGLQVKNILSSGKLVDDILVLKLLESFCDLEKNGYIFDGFPRNIEQAKLLDKNLLTNRKVLVCYFKLSSELLIDRIVNRRICSSCKKIYNLLYFKSKEENKCDLCGSTLLHRPDDQFESASIRMKIFETNIEPILNYYESKKLLFVVDASQKSDIVFKSLKDILVNNN